MYHTKMRMHDADVATENRLQISNNQHLAIDGSGLECISGGPAGTCAR